MQFQACRKRKAAKDNKPPLKTKKPRTCEGETVSFTKTNQTKRRNN